jgi:hypothetical protein
MDGKSDRIERAAVCGIHAIRPSAIHAGAVVQLEIEP